MNKTDLINAIAEDAKISKTAAADALSATIKAIETALTNDEKVVLVGFGTFEAKKRAARKGRNPSTKEVIDIPASKVPTFKAGKDLKAKVNK